MSWLWGPKPPTHNLRDYLQNAQIPFMRNHPSCPPMPPPNEKSHRNTLNVRRERRRFLTSIKRLAVNIKEKTKEYMVLMPDRPVAASAKDPDTDLAVTVPSSTKFDVLPSMRPLPQDIHDIANYWVQYFPMYTVQRILNIIYPEQTKGWRFRKPDYEGRNDTDQKIFTFYAWQPDAPLVGQRKPASLLVIVQPPWVLAPADIKNVSDRRTLSAFDPNVGKPSKRPMSKKEGKKPAKPLTKEEMNFYKFSSERVWAKLWDLCTDEHCTHFVITSHNEWVFGYFSNGWTTGYISEVVSVHDRDPNVLQMLLYWTAQSMGITDKDILPKVLEPVLPLFPRSDVEPARFPECQEPSEADTGLTVRPGDNEPRAWGGSQLSNFTLTSNDRRAVVSATASVSHDSYLAGLGPIDTHNMLNRADVTKWTGTQLPGDVKYARDVILNDGLATTLGENIHYAKENVAETDSWGQSDDEPNHEDVLENYLEPEWSKDHNSVSGDTEPTRETIDDYYEQLYATAAIDRACLSDEEQRRIEAEKDKRRDRGIWDNEPVQNCWLTHLAEPRQLNQERGEGSSGQGQAVANDGANASALYDSDDNDNDDDDDDSRTIRWHPEEFFHPNRPRTPPSDIGDLDVPSFEEDDDDGDACMTSISDEEEEH